MSVTVYVPSPLRGHAGGAAVVELEGAPGTVRETLDELFRLHPGLRDRVLTERGRLREHVHLFLGSERLSPTEGFDTRLEDGAELTILPAISGG